MVRIRRLVNAGLLAALAVSLSWGTALETRAQEAKKTRRAAPKIGVKSTEPEEKPAVNEEIYKIPEKASPKELLEFIENLRTTKIDAESRAQLIEHAIKVQKVTVEAAGRILAAKQVDAETAQAAVEAKLQALSLLARVGEEGAEEQLKKFAESLKDDKRGDIANAARTALLILKAQTVDTMSKEERQGFVDDLFAILKQGDLTREKAGLAISVGQLLEQFDTELAGNLYEKLSPIFKKAEDEAIQEYASRLEGTARRLKLLGNEMELAGETLDGKKFDWSQYRGKVVLVDYWATWCGPCIAELPNVKENYERYHEKGFDVVGISLDESKDDLEAFIKEQKIPWTQLFAAEKENQGWDHPMALRYGVSGIPTAILVDKDGKVVSLQARGEELTQQLEKLLGPVEKKDSPEADKPAEKKTDN